MRLLVLVPVALAVIVAVTALAGRLMARQTVDEVAARIEPARVAAAALSTALAHQESGSRAFVLTGDPHFLASYQDGSRGAGAATAQLTALLADDPAAQPVLAAATQTAEQWRAGAAEPEIAARSTNAPRDVDGDALRGEDLFDQFRTASGNLQSYLAGREAARLAAVPSGRAWVDDLTLGGVVLALVVGVAAPVVMRHRLTRPLDDLHHGTRAVAEGQEHLPITLDRPTELAAIATDADAMRRHMLARRDEAIEARLKLATRQTRDRLAGEVHDTTVQRLFALGLALDRVGTDEPRLGVCLAPLTAELDGAIRGLRALILGMTRTSVTGPTLRDGLFDLVRDSTPALGFTPAIGVHGDVAGSIDDETAVDLLSVLRESLSNIARHAEANSASIRLAIDSDTVALRVVDDGRGPACPDEVAPHGRGIASMTACAARHGGTMSIRPGRSVGTVVEWAIPRAAANRVETNQAPRRATAPLDGARGERQAP